MKFDIYDLNSKKVLATVNSKGEADRKLVELQKEHPKKKLWLRISKEEIK